MDGRPPWARRGLVLAQRATSAVEFSARRASAGFRPLPDFLIIGAQRSGTTSLYRWLTGRPDVAPSWKKEVHFFDNNYDRGLNWYRAHFPLRRAGTISGESTPYLLLHPLAPARAAHDLPDTRFIALLRDPVERAISNHWLRRQWGVARDETFEEALDLEPERMARETERVLRGEVSLEHMAHSYMARGEYAPQLRRWFEAVGRDRVLVLESERLSRDPRAAAVVLDWLGLPDLGNRFPVTNQASREESTSPEVLARLRAHFEPYNRDLFELLGYELWTDRPTGAPPKND